MTEPTRAELESASAILREVTGFHEHPDDCYGLALCIREAIRRERERCADIAVKLAEEAAIEYANGHAVEFRRIGDAIKEPSDAA